MERLTQDLRFAVRMLLKNPAFSWTAVLILALAIGTTVPTFSMMNAYLLRPLPFGDPDQLVHLWATDDRQGWEMLRVSVPDFLDWREQTRSFTDLAAFNYTIESLTGGEQPEEVSGARVSANTLDVLGRQPVMGRGFVEGEDAPGAPGVVIISHGWWESRFGANPNIVGTLLEVDNESHTIVGVMPADFVFPLVNTKLWMPRKLDVEKYPRDQGLVQIVGRLRDGVTPSQAESEMKAIAANLERQYPESNEGRGANVVNLRTALNFADEIFRIMWVVLFAAHAFVLLIACANISSLLLARAVRREKEVAIRTALGAERKRLIVQLLVESGLLAFVGGVLGLALAWAEIRFMNRMIPDDLYRVGEMTLDGLTLLFTVGITSLAAIMAGLVPAIRITASGINEVFRQASGTVTLSMKSLRLQSAFVIVQTALAVMLLIGTALMVRTFGALKNVDPGFDSDNVLAMRLSLHGDKYDAKNAIRSFHTSLIEQASSIPGVDAAATVDYLPLNHETDIAELDIPGLSNGDRPLPSAYRVNVSPEYFRVLEIPIVDGRVFLQSDDENAPPRVVINEEMAGRFWPGESAIGKTFQIRGMDDPFEIIGVVGNTQHRDLAEKEQMLQVYLSQAQYPTGYFRLLLATAGDPLSYLPQARAATWRVDPSLPIGEAMSLREVVDQFLLPQQVLSISLGVLSIGAILLAAVGLYGLMAFFVSQHTKEIGIRMAIGASKAHVLGIVIRRGLRLAGIGIAIGVVGAVILGRVMSSLLFGVGAFDPIAFIGVPIALGGIAAAASLLPARRAASLDPFVTLRVE